MLDLKILTSLLLISSILSFRPFVPNLKSIPNLLSNPNDIKNRILKELRKEASKYYFKYPSNWYKLITNLASTTEIKMDKITYEQINNLRKTHGFPENVIQRFKKIKYVKNLIVYDTFNFSLKKTKTTIETTFGIGARLDEKFLYITYVKGVSSGKSIPQYKQVPYKSCWRFLFFHGCKTKQKSVRRGYTNSELNVIQNALKAKYAEMLNSVLDLDQQKTLNYFKKYAKDVQKQKSSSFNYQRFIVNSYTTLDFKTVKINYNEINQRFSKIFSQKILKGLNDFKGKNNLVNQFHMTTQSKKNFKTIDYLIGVAYNSNNKMIISYAKGRANINLFHSYCLIKEKKRMRNENCMWDEDCMKDCNNFKRKYKNIENPLSPNIKNKKQREQQIKKNIDVIIKGLHAEFSNNIVKILDGIRF